MKREGQREFQQIPIAVIGMAGVFRHASDLKEYWQHILDGKDCLSDFAPFPCHSDMSSEQLSIAVAKQAMYDAGYDASRQFDRDATGLLLGMTPCQSVPPSSPLYASTGSLIAGQIARCLDIGGMHSVMYSAWAAWSSALNMAINVLTVKQAWMMLIGGIEIDRSQFSVSQYHCRPFDQEANGMVAGQGIGMLVLKRLHDAERDGDRIYAVIKGRGASGNGQTTDLGAPCLKGQIQALRRAYQQAGVSPKTLGLLEANGTGVVGHNTVEWQALQDVFSRHDCARHSIALGSVKFQIGHAGSAAGVASLIKAVLAVFHNILPPTIHVTSPHPAYDIDTSPFYLNTLARPWFRSDTVIPRRAGVSSCGFDGTNFHVVLEEYEAESQDRSRWRHPPASILLHAANPVELAASCERIFSRWHDENQVQVYRTLIEKSLTPALSVHDARVGFVASSPEEARNLLEMTIETLCRKSSKPEWTHPKGIAYRQHGMEPTEKVAALFSGQGSQYINMGRELVMHYPVCRHAYHTVDCQLRRENLLPVSGVVFPPPVFRTQDEQKQIALLQQTEYAQPAIGACSSGMFRLLTQAGFQPDVVAGHSCGEITAIWAAGVVNDEDFCHLMIPKGSVKTALLDTGEPGGMLSVKGDISCLQKELTDLPELVIANWNAPSQVVLAGPLAQLNQISHRLTMRGYEVIPLSVSAAFHTAMAAHIQRPFLQILKTMTFRPPHIPIFSNTSGLPYPETPDDIKHRLAEHLVSPVKFHQMIENMYAAGITVFVEIGPKNVLTHLVKRILRHRSHLAVALNRSAGKDSDRQLREAVMHLQVAGLALQTSVECRTL